MNSKVIKFVAGAGKTTMSIEYLKHNRNGLYLSFTNRVVEDIQNAGYLAKTIDSLFFSYIIPKFTSVLNIVGTGCNVERCEIAESNLSLKGVGNIELTRDGKFYNKDKLITEVSMDTKNSVLHSCANFPNRNNLRYIFDKSTLRLNDKLRENISQYLMENHKDTIIKLLEDRFSYIIIDEAQDLKGYREEFAKLLYESNLMLILYGDDNQNINSGGNWFEDLEANEYRNISLRCPEKNCEWIRTNLGIEIYGNVNVGEYTHINIEEVCNFDDGKRELLYNGKSKNIKNIIESWSGKKKTIKTAKGETISEDIVIIGKKLNNKNLYTAITRTTKKVYSTIK